MDERGTLPLPLFAGFALACVGGPLALAALYLPDAVGNRAIPAMGLTVAAGAAMFAFRGMAKLCQQRRPKPRPTKSAPSKSWPRDR